MLYANCTPNLLFQKISLCFYKTDISMEKIKCEIRSNVKGKLVPIYLNYIDKYNHFRIKTDFTVKQEYWNASKEIIMPIYSDDAYSCSGIYSLHFSLLQFLFNTHNIRHFPGLVVVFLGGAIKAHDWHRNFALSRNPVALEALWRLRAKIEGHTAIAVFFHVRQIKG